MFVRSISRRWLPRTALVAAAATALVLPFSTVGSATEPAPADGQTVGLITEPFGATLALFYQDAATGHLVEKIVGDGVADLGGTVTSGVSAMSIQPNTGTWWAFVRDGDGAVSYRQWATGSTNWANWASIGGQIVGPPSASCTRNATPVVWARSTNNALYQFVLSPGHSWTRIGGQLATEPVSIPTIMGACTGVDDVFMLGTNGAIYEWFGGQFTKLTGTTTFAPAAVRLPDGETLLFVRGANNALYYRLRAADSAAWGNWISVGGTLASAPSATVYQGAPLVAVQGTNGRLYKGQFGANGFVWTAIP